MARATLSTRLSAATGTATHDWQRKLGKVREIRWCARLLSVGVNTICGRPRVSRDQAPFASCSITFHTSRFSITLSPTTTFSLGFFLLT